MSGLGLKAELRDGNTIRAYLDELVRLKSPVQMWLTQVDAPPLQTTLVQVARDTFSTAQTLPMPAAQQLSLSFMIDARRFVAHTQMVATGVFRIPAAVAVGERRERFRASFKTAEGIQVFACERLSGTFVGGRTCAGRLMDLSLQGLRVLLDEVLDPMGEPASVKRGDVFAALSLSGLPYTPTIRCAGVVTHVRHGGDGTTAGFQLLDLEEGDQKNIDRILARRFPTTFGQAFPRKHRKTDLADQPGPPVATREAIKATEVVLRTPEPPVVQPRPPRPPQTAVLRIRKAVRKLLVISAGGDRHPSLAECLREDDFKQVFEAGSYLEAQAQARANRFDILLLDVKVGGHLGQMILETLRRHDLLLDTAVILVADRRDASAGDVAEAIGAVYVHEKRAPYEDLLPALYALLGT
jgi:CheY-like chemotaxis protein